MAPLAVMDEHFFTFVVNLLYVGSIPTQQKKFNDANVTVEGGGARFCCFTSTSYNKGGEPVEIEIVLENVKCKETHMDHETLLNLRQCYAGGGVSHEHATTM